ncbi:hypothetical protein C6501_00355 [Candidatus Poribacteria bacterium]|nr:MAG: hypothetical protein C6501_00355 [Candidatus Poribacteria bacterium]
MFWLLIEMLTFFIPDTMQWTADNFWVLIICSSVALVVTIIDIRRKFKEMFSVRESLADTNISLEIQVGDIFQVEGDFIIGTDTTFETNPIPEKSLQKQFTDKYYDNVEHLDRDLANALGDEKLIENTSGKSKRYKIGTVAKVSPKKQVVYLVAIDELNKEGEVVSSLENVRDSLRELWKYIRRDIDINNLVIPIIGTKHARIQIPRQVMITEIIESFLEVTYQGTLICEKLTIVIAKEDYDENIDLKKLGDYLHVNAAKKRWQEKPAGQPVPAEHQNEH